MVPITSSSQLARRQFNQALESEFTNLPQFEAFLTAFPAYKSTVELSRRRCQDFDPRPQDRPFDSDRRTYLDWTGAGKSGRSQRRAHFELLDSHEYGNPHSQSPDSRAATAEVKKARRAVLRHFNASADEYVVIFRANASDAMRIVGESYPFQAGRDFLFLRDNHNSALGIREYARAQGATVGMVDIGLANLRIDQSSLDEQLTRLSPGLFAFPAQSNFSGVQHSLGIIDQAQAAGWDVLLDAAAFAPTNRLDLSQYKPEFVALSFYKMFGYPTGVGCLLARKSALAKLRRPSFAGGTVAAASAIGGWHQLAEGGQAFEDGTVNFLGLPAIPIGLDYISRLSMIHDRVTALTGWLLSKLQQLRHTDGRPLIRLYGPSDTQDRGATIAFNFLDPEGRVVDERLVDRLATEANISLRTGCFCNPGCGEAAFALDETRLLKLQDTELAAGLSAEKRLRFIGMPSGGAIRVSLGQVSTFADVERCLDFAASFADLTSSRRSLPPRGHC